MTTLNLTTADRTNCTVTFNVNQFEVYHATGWLMFSAYDKPELKVQLASNSIKGAMFDSVAQRKYLAA